MYKSRRDLFVPAGVGTDSSDYAGLGMTTRRYVHISFTPDGQPRSSALSILYDPKTAGLYVPAVDFNSGRNTGDTLVLRRKDATGNYISGEYDGEEKFWLSALGTLHLEGVVRVALQSDDPDAVSDDDIVQMWQDSDGNLKGRVNKDADAQVYKLIDYIGYVDIPVGNQSIDLLESHFYTSTPDQNAEWTTASERQGHLVWMHVDNTGGHTITFGSGFTGVSDISDSDIVNKLLYYDGATWREIATGGGGGAYTVDDPISLVGNEIGLKYDDTYFQLDGSGNLQLIDFNMW